MGNRGQKRAELVDGFPADKRACSSLDSKPSSSNSSVEAHISTTDSLAPKAPDTDMTDDSPASASFRSEGVVDRDSAYGSCDSDDMDDEDDDDEERNTLREYQEKRAHRDNGKLGDILRSLKESDVSSQLVALTELCELLSFSTQSSMSGMSMDSLCPALVNLAKYEDSPEIMLLAVRAITYLCDVYPRSSSVLIRYDTVSVLCARLIVIEYLDLAEQCLQALEKISRDQPLVCLQAGAVMAVLSYIDFFTTSVKKVALSTVANICRGLPSECPPTFMDAVPLLANLLQYEDRQLVESAAICFINVVGRVSQSPDMLDALCNHGLIQQVAHLVNFNSQITLSQPVHTGLVGLLAKLASGSVIAVRTLLELNISSILKDLLLNVTVGIHFHEVDGRYNQVCVVLKLLNGILPNLSSDQGDQLQSYKMSFPEDQPDLFLKFGVDIMPTMIQIANSGANLHVRYGCLSVINKLVYFSKPDMLSKILENTNISSFLTGMFTQKNVHVLNLALQISEGILQKLSAIYLNSFIKEGLLFFVDAILKPEKCTELNSSGIKVSPDTGHGSSVKESGRCLCYALDTGRIASSKGSCKLEIDSILNRAKHIRANYFVSEAGDSDKGWTDVFQKLKSLSSALTRTVNRSINNYTSEHFEEEYYNLLHQILEHLCSEEPVSTFEFIESGIIKSLINYLSSGLYLRERLELHTVHNNLQVIDKYHQILARVILSMSQSKHASLLSLIQKLQHALASVESFPVTSNLSSKPRNSYAEVPNGCDITYPCIRVRFLRGDGETGLRKYRSEGAVTVDPLSSFDEIERFLRTKVIKTRKKRSKRRDECNSNVQPPQIPLDVNSFPEESTVPMEVDTLVSAEMQEDKAGVPEGVLGVKKAISGETASPKETHSVPADEALVGNGETDSSMDTEDSRSCSSINVSPKLLFYVDGKEVDPTLTLYQAIFQQQVKDDVEYIAHVTLWNQVHEVTYRKIVQAGKSRALRCIPQEQLSCLLSKAKRNYAPFSPAFLVSGLASSLRKLTPTYDILFLLKTLQGMNQFTHQIMSRERLNAFAEGRIKNLDDLKVGAPAVPPNEFVSSKLTEKIEQQMRDPLSIGIGSMPLWCNQLMRSLSFLFGFEAKEKFFRLAAFGPSRIVRLNRPSGSPTGRRVDSSLPRKKFLVLRDHIMDSAAHMMDLHAHEKAVLEVIYNEEVGTGLGPTLEFFTLVSNEFQKTNMGMWREAHNLQAESSVVLAPFGLFPRPWASTVTASNGIEFSEVMKKFVLLGKVVARALQDGRVMDLPFSRAFYKLLLEQELNLYDIQSFDPELYRTLLEFQALVDRQGYLETTFPGNKKAKFDLSYRNTSIEDLSLDFTLPGYPDYLLGSGPECKIVCLDNLREYVSLVVDATIHSGISRQVKAFKFGFNQVFPITNLQIFTEEELERLLCGESESWTFNELLDHFKFDHGYTANSPPIVNLLDIIQEFGDTERRAFLQFVTGAPRLPPGGLASLDPKLTVVRKQCCEWPDTDLPSVMTCANYLKLPPYSSKDLMREKLLYAITEGQGSFHLS